MLPASLEWGTVMCGWAATFCQVCEDRLKQKLGTFTRHSPYLHSFVLLEALSSMTLLVNTNGETV